MYIYQQTNKKIKIGHMIEKRKNNNIIVEISSFISLIVVSRVKQNK